MKNFILLPICILFCCMDISGQQQESLWLEHERLMPSGMAIENVSTTKWWTIYNNYSTDNLTLFFTDPTISNNGPQLKGYFDAVSGNYVPISDQRVKRNIQPIGKVLNKILDVNPTKYSFIEDKANKVYYGLIAQELKDIFPSIVHTFDEGTGIVKDRHAVSYAELIPILIKGMQEQQLLIEELNARVKDLENK